MEHLVCRVPLPSVCSSAGGGFKLGGIFLFNKGFFPLSKPRKCWFDFLYKKKLLHFLDRKRKKKKKEKKLGSLIFSRMRLAVSQNMPPSTEGRAGR